MADIPTYRIERFGKEEKPIAIIDGFSGQLEALRDHAAQQSYQKLGPFYPGIRAQMQPQYLATKMPLLQHILTSYFDCGRGMKLTESAYSLVTTPQAELTPIQRLPHYDGLDPGILAVLHYLSSDAFGGTAFYRHKATGFESLTEARFPLYKKTLEAEAKEVGLPKADYHRGDNDQFEQIGLIDAKPDRLVIYHGNTLHSGFIPEGFEPDPDPKTGRLTVNIFLQRK